MSVKLPPKGSPSERLWIIAEAPLSKDADSGYLFSSPMGWSYDKLLRSAGISNYYCTYFDGDADTKQLEALNHYQPPLVVVLDTAGKNLLPQIRSMESANLWASSLLTSPKLNYPHYCIPTFGPETCIKDWTERAVVKAIDYGKVKDELEYWQQHKVLRPLKARKLEIDLDYRTLINKLLTWIGHNQIEYISVDIETVYPKEKSKYFGHPGYPVTVGIAPSAEYGISFSLFQETTEETVRLWKVLGELMWKKKIIGQNFHSFDAWFFQMLGMPVDRFKIYDTMHRHAVLWPELSHKLQFLTRQYTRENYYKSEGHGWSIKDLSRLKRYNCLDVCVTYEVFNEQEKEFDERPYLR